MSCARQAGTSVLRKIRKGGGGVEGGGGGVGRTGRTKKNAGEQKSVFSFL